MTGRHNSVSPAKEIKKKKKETQKIGGFWKAWKDHGKVA